MIHEEICTYEVAKLAKEKGFPQRGIDSNKYWFENFKGIVEEVKDNVFLYEIYPESRLARQTTQSLLQRWLRDTHAIDIDIYPIFTDGATDKREYGCQIYAVSKSNKPLRIGYAKTYENMLDKALKYALENLV